MQLFSAFNKDPQEKHLICCLELLGGGLGLAVCGLISSGVVDLGNSGI